MLTIIKTFKRYILLLVVVLSASSFSASGGYDWCYVLGKMANDFEISSKFKDFIYKGHEDLKYIYKGLIDHPNWVRLNDDLYTKINTPAFKNKIDKVADYYKNTIPKNTPTGFNGEGIYDGVKFNKFGHPELIGHVSDQKHIVKIKMNGNYNSDFTDAKNALLPKLSAGEKIVKYNKEGAWSPFYIEKNGVKNGPFTWHHHQDGTSMYPVLKSIHDKIAGKHTGGKEIVTKYPDLIGFFTQP